MRIRGFEFINALMGCHRLRARALERSHANASERPRVRFNDLLRLYNVLHEYKYFTHSG